MSIQIGAVAPNLKVSEWVQGRPVDIAKEKGNVVLIEVFQVNCPGCFLYGIPEVINIYNRYHANGLRVIGLATAFEDYDKNTLSNLKLLLSTGEVIGETLKSLQRYGQLVAGNKLPYKIPFSVAMDLLTRETAHTSDSRIFDFIQTNVPNYRSYIEKDKEILVEQVRQYLKSKQYSAATFEEYGLRGTPSTIVIDKDGIVRQKIFGSNSNLDNMVKILMQE
jgi:thiol-disulfide isomerase/thioredoxin